MARLVQLGTNVIDADRLILCQLEGDDDRGRVNVHLWLDRPFMTVGASGSSSGELTVSCKPEEYRGFVEAVTARPPGPPRRL